MTGQEDSTLEQPVACQRTLAWWMALWTVVAGMVVIALVNLHRWKLEREARPRGLEEPSGLSETREVQVLAL